MSEVTLSKAVRSNLLNLQATANKLASSQERLSTGLKVNTALDNPTNFFIAEGLKSKASDLSALSDAVSNAVQTVAAADKGITAIT
jgi:flagellin-like hook-associated protein FlgL